ncbi:TM2 domain-containing protein [Orrella daihaiensis]
MQNTTSNTNPTSSSATEPSASTTDQGSRVSLTKPAVRPVRSKVMAGLLSFYGGWFGAHWFYLGRRYPWVLGVLAAVLLFLASRAEIWWDTPAMFLLFIPAIAGFIEAIVLCLTSDAKFDARYNPGFVRDKPTGWGPVLVASFGLLIGTVLTMFAIAHVVLHIWSRLGWLDGLNF